MTQPSLAALLAAVERMQQQEKWNHTQPECGCDVCVLVAVDIPAIRLAAHQHAEALREVDSHKWFTKQDTVDLRAAIDFLDGEQ